MNFSKIKGLFLKVLIACLVAAAMLAVVTVLVGKFNDVLSKALFTIMLVALHSLISFAFITNNEKQDTFESLTFFTNATFGIIILSFVTSVLGTWGVMEGGLVFRLYCLYFVLLFAVLHGETLAQTMGKQVSIDKIVYANYLFMAIVVVMLMPVIFMQTLSDLGSFYYRLLAAAGIIDATLTLIAVIMHKLYIQKHPKIVDPVFAVPMMPGVPGQPMVAVPPKKRHMNIFVMLLLIYAGVQLVVGVAVAVIGRIH